MRDDPKQPDEGASPEEQGGTPDFPDPGSPDTYGANWPGEEKAEDATEWPDPGLTGTQGHERQDDSS
jgi:hypothetical protein